MYKLYSEVYTGNRGEKPYAPNVAIHVGLQDSTLGNTNLRHIMTTTNTPSPSRSGMQKTSNQVSTITSQSTTDDLQQNRENTREVNVLRDLAVSAPINISMDVRYNSTSLKNSYGCGQQEIIGVHLENKLCKQGASLHNQGQNTSWPGHQGCTATIRAVEFEIGCQIGISFAQHQVGIKCVETDGDVKASHGLQDAMPIVATERKLTQHI